MKNVEKLRKECEKAGMELEDVLDYLQANINHGNSTEFLEFLGTEEKILEGGVFKEKVVSFKFVESKTGETVCLVVRHSTFAAVKNEAKVIVYYS